MEKFTKRLLECSSQFRDVIAVTNWIQTQKDNQIFFVNITDHTNDELEKIILNYYYKEKIEYMFYDTLKKLSKNGERLILVIAGNHDNPERLVAAGPLAMEHGIIMSGTPKTVIQCGEYGQHKVINSGEGFIEIEIISFILM